MTYSEREAIFSKEALNGDDIMKLFGVCRTEATKIMQQIKRKTGTGSAYKADSMCRTTLITLTFPLNGTEATDFRPCRFRKPKRMTWKRTLTRTSCPSFGAVNFCITLESWS